MRSIRYVAAVAAALMGATPAMSQLVGGGSASQGGTIIPGATSTVLTAADLDGAWGGMMACPDGQGWAAFWDFATQGGKTVVQIRFYGRVRGERTGDVADNGDGTFRVTENWSGGWDYDMRVEDGVIMGNPVKQSQTCELRMVRRLGGMDAF